MRNKILVVLSLFVISLFVVSCAPKEVSDGTGLAGEAINLGSTCEIVGVGKVVSEVNYEKFKTKDGAFVCNRLNKGKCIFGLAESWYSDNPAFNSHEMLVTCSQPVEEFTLDASYAGEGITVTVATLQFLCCK